MTSTTQRAAEFAATLFLTLMLPASAQDASGGWNSPAGAAPASSAPVSSSPSNAPPFNAVPSNTTSNPAVGPTSSKAPNSQGGVDPDFEAGKPLGNPIKVTSTEMLRRYVEQLATRHGFPAPPSTMLTRSELGKYYLQLMPRLAALPADQLSAQDLKEIGMLTDEFEDSMQEVKGTIALRAFKSSMADSKELESKINEAHTRLSALEKLKINGDLTFFPQADMGKRDRDSIAANLRARVNFFARVHESKPDDRLGDGYLFARMTAAAGRFFPRNLYLLSPFNDLVDANASPFNSGPNEIQIPNLVINNNNSNSLRPTVSLEQAYYSQDFRPGLGLKGNSKAGLISMGAMFDNNNYANNESLQFVNTQFVNSTSWRPNFNGPALAFSLEKPLLRNRAFFRATSAMTTITNRDVYGCWGTNHELQFGHIFFNKEGNLRAGFWNWSFRRGTNVPFTTPQDLFGTSIISVIPDGNPLNGPRPVGMYMNFDQKIWKDIGIWGRYAMNDKNIGQVFLGGLLSSRQSFSFGAEIPMKSFFKRRPDDVIGIAYGQISGYNRLGIVSPATPAFLSLNGVTATTIGEVNQNLSTINPGPQKRNEKTLEAYYRYHINKNVSVSPDMQYIWSPGGTGPTSGVFVLGSRLNVVF